MVLDMKIVTYRDIFQYEAGKKGMNSDEYLSLSAVIFLDRQDMACLGISDGAKVRVENEVGRVVLKAKASEEPHPGVAFMVSSPWSHQLEKGELCAPGAAGFGGISARVAPSGDAVTSLPEILQRLRA